MLEMHHSSREPSKYTCMPLKRSASKDAVRNLWGFWGSPLLKDGGNQVAQEGGSSLWFNPCVRHDTEDHRPNPPPGHVLCQTVIKRPLSARTPQTKEPAHLLTTDTASGQARLSYSTSRVLGSEYGRRLQCSTKRATYLQFVQRLLD